MRWGVWNVWLHLDFRKWPSLLCTNSVKGFNLDLEREKWMPSSVDESQVTWRPCCLWRMIEGWGLRGKKSQCWGGGGDKWGGSKRCMWGWIKGAAGGPGQSWDSKSKSRVVTFSFSCPVKPGGWSGMSGEARRLKNKLYWNTQQWTGKEEVWERKGNLSPHKLIRYKNNDNRPRKSKQTVYFIQKVLWLLW